MRPTRRLLTIAGLTAILAASLPPARAVAATPEVPFTEPAFAEAQKSGKPILIEVQAPWCPVCAKQRPILSELFADPANKDMVVLKVDFDSQKDALHLFNVQKQSTLLAFHGSEEKARSTGDTNPESIAALVGKTRS